MKHHLQFLATHNLWMNGKIYDVAATFCQAPCSKWE